MYKEKIIDLQTGTISFRDFTDEEILEVEKAKSDAQAKAAEQLAKVEQRAAIFKRLGITEDEAKLLLS